MAGLLDMEELLGTMANREIVGYMHEALACYGAGAHCGCIVLSYIALFDDIRLKLLDLAKVNSQARTISQEVEKRSREQEIFESYMADQLQKEGLITQADYKQLEIIRDIRNRAAHPSGVQAKAEEARYVYRVVISDFLSRPLLKTTHAVDAILDRLPKTNLFPTSRLEDYIAIARAEIASVHEAAFPYLVAKLISARSASDITTSNNARRMLTGIAAFHEPEFRRLIRTGLIIGKSHDADYSGWISRIVAADAKLLETLSSDAVLRIRAILIDSADATDVRVITSLRHPMRQLTAMIEALGETVIMRDYAAFATKVIPKHCYQPQLLDALASSPALRNLVVQRWKNNACSTTFDTANAFVDALPVVDDYARTFLSGSDAFDIIACMMFAADWNARRAKSARAPKFSTAPEVRDMAINYAKADPEQSEKIIQARLPTSPSLNTFLADAFDIQ